MNHYRTALLIVAGAIAGIIFGFALLRTYDRLSAPEILIVDPIVEAEIAIAIDGAVATPGVYRVPGNARLDDVVAIAGGLADNADTSGLNLAARLRDAEQISVPTALPAVQELQEPQDPEEDNTDTVLDQPVSVVDINSASVAELETLPGIGPGLATLIVSEREREGPFESIEDLARISGISDRMVTELASMIEANE